MKSVILCLLITTAFSCSNNYLEKIDYVKEAQVVRLGDIVVVSVMLEPIFLFTEKVRVLSEIENAAIKEENAAKAVVSSDIDIWYKVKSAKENYDSELINSIIKEIEYRNYKLNYDMQL